MAFRLPHSIAKDAALKSMVYNMLLMQHQEHIIKSGYVTKTRTQWPIQNQEEPNYTQASIELALLNLFG